MKNNMSAKGHLKIKWLETLVISFVVFGVIWYLLSGIPTYSNQEDETREEHIYVSFHDESDLSGLDKTE